MCPIFRAYERAFQMMSQVAGRAGRRGKKRGLVVMQTKQPDLPVVQQIVTGNYLTMYREQIEERTLFHYPPVYRLINIVLKHRDEHVVAHAAESMAGLLRPHFGTDLLGPDRPVVSRIQHLFIRMITLKLSPETPTAGCSAYIDCGTRYFVNQSGFKSVIIFCDRRPLIRKWHLLS